MDLRTGNSGDELFKNFDGDRTEIGKNIKSLNLWMDRLDKK